jgi:hypothetical protein
MKPLKGKGRSKRRSRENMSERNRGCWTNREGRKENLRRNLRDRRENSKRSLSDRGEKLRTKGIVNNPDSMM